MRVINVRNVHEALPEAIRLLQEEGVSRETRNGPVLMVPFPVATVYSHPYERVLFHPERDANPFLHLYEAFWMLAGRREVKPLTRYTKQFLEYSDDGQHLHDAYGYRWRQHFGFDQIPKIVCTLRENENDRRCVLQMWDPKTDLGVGGKAFPCNLTITFSRMNTGALDMVVFNRSNDIIWGAYGANAVHFSVLQEYIASEIECPIGTYTQISTNWHAYTKSLGKLLSLPTNQGIYGFRPCPYRDGLVTTTVLTSMEYLEDLMVFEEHPMDYDLDEDTPGSDVPWIRISMRMFQAFYVWRNKTEPERFSEALAILAADPDQKSDWIVAGREWLLRRQDAWTVRMAREHETLGEA